jgi:hypothetical protein
MSRYTLSIVVSKQWSLPSTETVSNGTPGRNSLFAFVTENGLKVKKRGNSRHETPPENVIYFGSQMNIALGIPNGTLP